jgi:hypothetical protein
VTALELFFISISPFAALVLVRCIRLRPPQVITDCVFLRSVPVPRELSKRGRLAQSAVRVCDVCHRGRKILLFDLFFRSSIARWLCYIPTSPTAVLKSGAGG